jgi:hypothetical protein
MKKACGAGAGGAFLLAAGGAALGQEPQAAPETPAESAAEAAAETALETCEKEREFSQEWIVNAVGSIEERIGGEAAILFLEECGRACARKGAVKAAVANKGDLDGLLAVLRGWVGEGNIRREGNAVTLVYGKCYCPNLCSFAGTVPRSYCNCSRGWVKEMFETVTGTPCEVALISSVARGDAECRFEVRV